MNGDADLWGAHYSQRVDVKLRIVGGVLAGFGAILGAL
jgi:hypothetical protein